MPGCHYCGNYKDVPEVMRPYGPGGALVCFDCVFEEDHPERQEEAAKQFVERVQMAYSVSNVVVIGGKDGPEPASAEIIEKVRQKGIPVKDITAEDAGR